MQNTSNIKTISNLKIGESGVIDKIVLNDQKLKRRLLELGFVKNTKIKVTNFSILNDVVLIEIMGYVISLRQRIASKIVLKGE